MEDFTAEQRWSTLTETSSVWVTSLRLKTIWRSTHHSPSARMTHPAWPPLHHGGPASKDPLLPPIASSSLHFTSPLAAHFLPLLLTSQLDGLALPRPRACHWLSSLHLLPEELLRRASSPLCALNFVRQSHAPSGHSHHVVSPFLPFPRRATIPSFFYVSFAVAVLTPLA